MAKNNEKFVLFNIFDDNAPDRMPERINMEECKTCVATGIAQITHSGISTMPDWADKLKNYEWKLEKYIEEEMLNTREKDNCIFLRGKHYNETIRKEI